jgi:hypothetical protein
MAAMADMAPGKGMHLVYASKFSGPNVEDYLFGQRIQEVRDKCTSPVTLQLFLTGINSQAPSADQLPIRSVVPTTLRRPTIQDIDSLASEQFQWPRTVCYVCGPPAMADEFYGHIASKPGMSSDRLLCERWW